MEEKRGKFQKFKETAHKAVVLIVFFLLDKPLFGPFFDREQVFLVYFRKLVVAKIRELWSKIEK